MYKIVKANLLILRPDLHVKSLYQLIIIGSQQDTSNKFFPSGQGLCWFLNESAEADELFLHLGSEMVGTNLERISLKPVKFNPSINPLAH